MALSHTLAGQSSNLLLTNLRQLGEMDESQEHTLQPEVLEQAQEAFKVLFNKKLGEVCF